MEFIPAESNGCSQNRNVPNHRSKSNVIAHVINGWTVQESSEPFVHKDNKSASSIHRKRQRLANKSNVHQWNTGDVCLFCQSVLGTASYTSLIEEHLIDGTALLLLEENHLIKTFQMPVDYRRKLLRKIKRLRLDNRSA